MDERLVELVLRAVDLIPPGRVAAYGDLGRIVGIGPRQVGAVMSRHGDGSTWWRVTDAAGNFAPDLLERARPHWLEEGIVIRSSGRGCRIEEHRADLDRLARQWRTAVADLDEDAQEAGS
ncbi:MAG: cysteine methyltransferase [Nocardioides sp.]|jgi:methylated-DNA-protein-cysteine methyltransferase-like protein|uniref:MGMT family protein n=1 Tax=Nocardioides sp. TaxID=35761 RepID=UPI00261D22E1|nr:MGMT family protein [Nocardioides sp.]MCW2835151.1 cysteine methyltransferase [Nocardioides sp.]